MPPSAWLCIRTRNLLGWHDRFRAVGFEFLAAGMLALCSVCFLSFVSAAEDCSGYQSDGMLLEAGFISLFFVPAGFRPGWGEESRPSRARLFYWCGNASGFISNRAWQRSWAATRSGAISRRSANITRTGRCPLGSAGTCNTCRPGSTRRRTWGPWPWSWGWHG